MRPEIEVYWKIEVESDLAISHEESQSKQWERQK